MSPQRVLVYLLRRDLRVADNPVFNEISKLASQSRAPFTHILPVYVFAAQQLEVSGFLSNSDSESPYPEARSEIGKFWRCGPHRAKFLTESVWDLKKDLESKGSGLVIRAGLVGDVIKDILTKFKETKEDVSVAGVWMTQEEGVEEKREEKDVRNATEAAGIDFRLWLDEKYFIDDRDLPFDNPRKLPDVFTSYRKSVEPLRDAPRAVCPTPKSLPALPKYVPPQAQPFSMPSSFDAILSSLLKPLENDPVLKGMGKIPSNVQSAHPFTGGAVTGQKRILHLISTASMTHYKATRNGLLGLDFSTKLSAWLALGCITARQVHFRLLAFEDGKDDQFKGTEGYGKGENAGTAAVRFELLWRDYMRLCTRKFGPRLFRLGGFRDDDSYQWKTPGTQGSGPDVAETLDRVLRGTTGTGLIDASQRELWHTGYTSNRARQNVASYLSKHLGLNWKLGAEWYECMLTDYDLSSNWGNWQYVAGVGNDPRGEARVFNPIKQAVDYDVKGEYVKAWVEETRGLDDTQEVFQIWKVSPDRRKELGLEGNIMCEKPLKKIDFRVNGKPNKSGGSGGGRYGGSSRGHNGQGHGQGHGQGGHGHTKTNGTGESGRGKNGNSNGNNRGGNNNGRGSARGGSRNGDVAYRSNAGRMGHMERSAMMNGDGVSA